MIKTKRLVIKEFIEEDLNDIAYILVNKEIAKTYMIPDFENQEQVNKLANRFIELSNGDKKFLNGVFLNNKVIGFVNEVDKCEDSIEIGYVIHPDYKNQGYATEMFEAVIQEMFNRGIKKVKAGFFSHNIASKRVMEKCGLKKVDFEEDIEYKGVIHHCIYYEISND